MGRFIEGYGRRQALLLADCVDDYVGEENPVRVIDVFVDELDLATLGSEGAAATGRPGYHPATLLKLYLYGYMNQVQSSRRLEREAGRNVEVMWLTGKLAPDFKTIADFRRDNGEAVRAACKQFVILCREIGLIASGTVAADGSRFKAVNTRDKNYTPGAIRLRLAQVEASIERYLDKLDTADRQEADVAEMPTTRLNERIEALRQQMRTWQVMAHEVETAPDRSDLADRPGRRCDGHERQGHGPRRLQCPSGGRYGQPHRRGARGHEPRP